MASIKDTQKAMQQSGSMRTPDKWYSVSLSWLKKETKQAIDADLKKWWSIDKSLRSFVNSITGKPVTKAELSKEFQWLTLDGKPVNGRQESARSKSNKLLNKARKSKMK